MCATMPVPARGEVTVQFRVLGTLEVLRDGRPVPLRRRRMRAVLAVLLLDADRVVPAERLVAELWGDEVAVDRALDGLHVTVHALRRALEPGRAPRTPPSVLVSQPPGYVLRLGGAAVDAHDFARLAADGHQALRDGSHRTALEHLDQALALWRGPALSDFAEEPFARPEVARLDELHLAAREDRIAALLALGEHVAVVAELEALVSQHPMREQLSGQLALALYRAGRQADALAALSATRRTLADELGIDPAPQLARLEHDVLHQSPALEWVPPRQSTVLPGAREATPRVADNLPHQLTSFVGRDEELAQLAGLLADARLLTLTGPGGSGKSRLALEAAARARPDFPDGVCLVTLGQLSDAALLPRTVAAALGVAEKPGEPIEDVLVAHLSEERLLLVVDGCEHLLDASARLVWSLLASCPHLHVLATSREALGVQGEQVLDVPTLALPVDGTPAAVRASDAGRLFVDRARVALPSFRLTEATAPLVAHTCRRLDGIPLALELAAARLRGLSLEEVSARLEDRFGLLTLGNRAAEARHSTLQGAMDWSYHLLDERHRALFARVSVFAGGFDVAAAEALAAGALPRGDVVDVLGRLVDKSLVVLEHRDAGGRYRLLETIRQYAGQRLEERAEAAAAREQHAACYLALAEEAEQRLQGPDQRRWLDRLEADHDNVRAALALLAEREDHVARLRVGAALWRYCYLRGHYQEGREWLESALRAVPSPPPLLGARALTGAGALAFYQCDYDEAEQRCQAALRLYRELDDSRGTGIVLTLLGSVARERGDRVAALDRYRESHAAFTALDDAWGAGNALQLSGFVSWLHGGHDEAAALSGEALLVFRALGDDERAAWAELDLGAAAYYRGDVEGGSRLLTESLALFERVEFKEGVAWALNLLGLVAHSLGDHATAAERLERSLAIHRELGDRWRACSVMEALAAVACARGDSRAGAALMGGAAGLRDLIGTPVPPVEAPLRQRTLEALGVDELGRPSGAGPAGSAVAAAWEAGRAGVLGKPRVPAGRAAVPGADPRAQPAFSRR